ncbi:16S rRNA (uracil(1498)-N(3))-methyltransferase [Desulfopila sp. IMCC35006]|uniref:16S rRNA (uracil(1498)-N(3))-methyltransferase n=1 Tax=Desulfopila sp. IMCC35006 TaxID=2569542 RepID=UPI0010ADA402|nr:16S rRNA (uracil(1498)-N(3))-methyltransferase [Desulfopila sp. IMCC35006]TKB25977.1 16S rRNA (uracil(1498)-N(3))-methyltransferase [Desulfopila sp. IMCC35006]
MNIILAEEGEVADSQLTLVDHRAKHIVKVLRAEVGDRVRVGLINGAMGCGIISAMHKKHPFTVDLDLTLNEPPRPRPTLDLVLALPRPIMLKRILSQVTALGVGTIHLINANRVEKSFWEAGILQPEEYRSHLLHGLEQAVDTSLPHIRLHPQFKPFIEDFFPSLASDYRHLLLAHPTGTQLIGEVIDSSNGRVALAVGPEGGWVEYEVKKFQEQGFSGCTIGERILKVDTAVVALHARISALREMLSERV